MNIIFKGRHVEVTEALRNYTEKRLNKIDRHLENILEVIVTFSVEKSRQIVEVTLQAKRALIRAEEESDDMYTSIDKVVDKLDRQIQKYREKYLQKTSVENYKTELTNLENNLNEEQRNNLPLIVKTKKFALKPMSVEEAAMQMDLLGHSFYVFANDLTNRVNVIYKRKDGNFGLIEPEF
ncbi:MAG: ribosome-associated translation inhibitor RaiA [Candidatus Caldatribacteriota bacterium]